MARRDRGGRHSAAADDQPSLGVLWDDADTDDRSRRTRRSSLVLLVVVTVLAAAVFVIAVAVLTHSDPARPDAASIVPTGQPTGLPASSPVPSAVPSSALPSVTTSASHGPSPTATVAHPSPSLLRRTLASTTPRATSPAPHPSSSTLSRTAPVGPPTPQPPAAVTVGQGAPYQGGDCPKRCFYLHVHLGGFAAGEHGGTCIDARSGAAIGSFVSSATDLPQACYGRHNEPVYALVDGTYRSATVTL